MLHCHMVIVLKNGTRRVFDSQKEERLYMVLKKMGHRRKGRIPKPSTADIQAAGANMPSDQISRLLQSLEEKEYLDRSWQIF